MNADDPQKQYLNYLTHMKGYAGHPGNQEFEKLVKQSRLSDLTSWRGVPCSITGTPGAFVSNGDKLSNAVFI
jgi:hypothetical protein